MLDIAEERDFCFLFTDVQKITDQEANAVFNSMVKTVFLLDNIAEFVGSKAMQDRAITIEMGEGAVSVEVQIILMYGAYIPEVAGKVQEAIRTQVQDTTGMPVEKVNVIIMDIEQRDDTESDEEEGNE